MRAEIVQDREQVQGTLPPTPDPLRGSGGVTNRRAEWVRERAIAELRDIEQRSGDVAATVRRYQLGEAGLVEVYWEWTRPKFGRPRWLDAPSGLRRRDIVAGLQRAAMDWAGTCAR